MRFDAPAIVIAAGGDGVRIGGNKPGRLLGGMRLIDRAVAWAQRHSDTVALAVQQGGGDWGTGLRLLHDRRKGEGPIGALSNALRFAHAENRHAVLLIGCDQPFLPDDLVPRLEAALPPQGVALPYSNGRLQPLAALWRAGTDVLERYMAGGKRSLIGFAEQIGQEVVEWPERPDPFMNVNDEAALGQAERRLRTQAP